MHKKISVIDLFAGCGGLTDGFERTGKYSTLACVEWEKNFSNVLAKRLKDKWKHTDAASMVITFDIQRINELIYGWNDDQKYGSSVGLDKIIQNKKNNRVDLIIGGPPCQAYSIAGRIQDKHGMENDYRNFLFESYIKVLNKYEPDMFVFENVPGILSAAPGGISILSRIREAFSLAGYEIIDNIKEYAVIDMAEYGVPQRRKRVILIGIKKSSTKQNIQLILQNFYKKILPKHKEKKLKTVGETIMDLPKFHPLLEQEIISGKKYSHRPLFTEFFNHTPRFHSKRDIEIFKELAGDSLRKVKLYDTVDKIKSFYTKKTGKISNIHKYYVLKKNEPSNTIVAHLHKDGLRHIHPDPEQARSISVREAARLQTFEDDFLFDGSIGNQYKMIGNAVPPLFAQKLGEAVYNIFTSYVGK